MDLAFKKIKECEESAWQSVRCTRQSALIADRNVKFLSNLTQADQFIAESAGLREGLKEDLNIEDTDHDYEHRK